MNKRRVAAVFYYIIFLPFILLGKRTALLKIFTETPCQTPNLSIFASISSVPKRANPSSRKVAGILERR